jgi:hypothetical protein
MTKYLIVVEKTATGYSAFSPAPPPSETILCATGWKNEVITFTID